MAIEDAVVLARCLRDILRFHTPSPPTSGYAAPGRTHRRAGRDENSKAAGPVSRVVRDLMMPMILKRVANVDRSRGCTTTASSGTRRSRDGSMAQPSVAPDGEGKEDREDHHRPQDRH